MGGPVTLRTMTAKEYDEWTAAREDEVTRELSATMPADEARARAVQGTARFLPAGRDTVGHQVLIAANSDGRLVGNAWVGPDPRRPAAPDSAWLYDLNVYPADRRQGYASAILQAIEEMLRSRGVQRIGLNVFGSNPGASQLYAGRGFTVISQSMNKELA